MLKIRVKKSEMLGKYEDRSTNLYDTINKN